MALVDGINGCAQLDDPRCLLHDERQIRQMRHSFLRWVVQQQWRNDEPLSFLLLRVSDHVSGFVEFGSVGKDVPTMPLFLTSERYVNIPLNDSYTEALTSFPRPWQELLEPHSA